MIRMKYTSYTRFTISIGQSYLGKLLCFLRFDGWIVATDVALVIPTEKNTKHVFKNLT